MDYLIRDRDACYGNLFVRRVRSLGIRDRPTSPRSPWQNGYAERLIGSIRREIMRTAVPRWICSWCRPDLVAWRHGTSNCRMARLAVEGAVGRSLSVLSATRVGFSHGSKHSHHRIAREFAAMSARIAHKRLNELQRRRLLRRTSTHNPVPILIGENREVLHRLHISPTGQRFPRAWDVDFPSGALSALLEALTITCQLVRVFDCGRAPCADARSQSAPSAGCVHISSACGAVLAEGCPLFRSQSRFPSEIDSTGRVSFL